MRKDTARRASTLQKGDIRRIPRVVFKWQRPSRDMCERCVGVQCRLYCAKCITYCGMRTIQSPYHYTECHFHITLERQCRLGTTLGTFTNIVRPSPRLLMMGIARLQ